MTAPTSPRPQQGVQSVEIGLQVAKALASSPTGGMSLSELAGAVGMPASKVHRYVVSLCRVGLAEQDPSTGLYDLSWGAIRFGLAAEIALPHLQHLSDPLQELHRQCRAPVAAAIWTRRGPAIVRKAEAEHPLVIDTRIGVPLSMLNSSMGRLFAAFLPAEQVDPLVNAEFAAGAAPKVDGKNLSKSEFRSLLKEIREARISFHDGDLVPGLRAVGAPVFDSGGKIVMTISMITVPEETDISPGSDAVKALKMAAARISKQK